MAELHLEGMTYPVIRMAVRNANPSAIAAFFGFYNIQIDYLFSAESNCSCLNILHSNSSIAFKYLCQQTMKFGKHYNQNVIDVSNL